MSGSHGALSGSAGHQIEVVALGFSDGLVDNSADLRVRKMCLVFGKELGGDSLVD